MAKLAILGFGTVGSGVLEALRRNAARIERRLGQPLEAKYILDIRDFSGHPDASLFVKDLDIILQDKEVELVVETIGGTKPAYDFVLRALQSGRHVVTSNKEMVSTYGATLLATAKQNNVCFLFEASVGGGTPVITPMHQCMAANNILAVEGIVNGTTNFMLTRMEYDGADFDEALKEAQDLGYAETIDPSSDVDGIDAGRKIAILSSLAFGKHIHPQNVSMRGIRSITPVDMQVAKSLNGAVKLIAWAHKQEGQPLSCGVEPMLVSKKSQLAGVEDVFNAVLVEGDMLGDVVFYGKGAGKLPTASAVVADAIDAIKEGVTIHNSLFWQPAEPIEGTYTDERKHDYYVRVSSQAGVAELLKLQGSKAIEDAMAAVITGFTDAELTALRQKLKEKEIEVELTLKMLP